MRLKSTHSVGINRVRCLLVLESSTEVTKERMDSSNVVMAVCVCLHEREREREREKEV